MSRKRLGRLVETLADHDDALLEKVLEDIKPTPDELYRDMRKDLLAGAVIEVLVGARRKRAMACAACGRRCATTRLIRLKPRNAAGSYRAGRHVRRSSRPPMPAIPASCPIARIWSGTITDGAQLGGTRLGGIYRYVNGELTKVPEARQGDIVAFGRLDGVPTGATVSPGGQPEPLPFPQPTPPVYAMAIATTDRKDDVKLSGALQKLAEEDPSLFVTQDGETVLHGQGEMHLQTTVDHLARDYGLKLATQKPAVAYKETIRKPVHEHGRLKRQTGGHGQFADVKIDIAPRARGEGFQFIDKIVGGAVPRNFIPAVGEAAEEATDKGPFGYPVVDVVGNAGRWRLPLGRQLRHGVQDRNPDRDEGRAGQSRPGAAGAGGPRHHQRAERLYGPGAAAADRPARPDSWLCRASGLARLG